MFCNSIEEFSLLYLENELDKKEKNQLLKHIKKCDKCRLMFSFIKTNYHAEEKVAISSPLLSEKISSIIDKSIYPISRTVIKSFSMKRILVVSVILALFIFTTVNAKTIYKSYKELINTMFHDSNLDNITKIVLTGTYSDENYVKSVYDKYQADVTAFISHMKRAEISSLKFNENGKSFKIKIAKGIKGDSISYGFEGYKQYFNDYSNNYFMSLRESDHNGIIKYSSIEELLGAVGISPIPSYIPNGYKFAHSFQLPATKGRIIPESIKLAYKNDKDEFLYIALNRFKMDAGNVREALEIGEYQAVYSEDNTNNGKAKDETNKTYRTISIFLGDSAKFPILNIESYFLDKETLLKVAKNVKIANQTENLIKAADYFKGIEDKKILAYADSYLENIKAGKTEFNLKIDKDTEIYKCSGNNDIYALMYRHVSIDTLKSIIPLQLNLNKALLNRFEYADVQISGRPYSSADKTYSIKFRNKSETIFSVSMRSLLKYKGDLELTDQIIAQWSHLNNKVKPLFSSSDHLYYLQDTGYNQWVLETLYEENGMVHVYTFTIDKEIMTDEKAIMDFINSL